LKYKYQYIDRLEGEGETIEAFMGSRVHEALEKLYRDLSVTKRNTMEELIAFYDAQWEKNWNDRVIVVYPEYTADHYRELGRQCLREYYERFQPFNDGKTLGLEDRFTITIQHGEAAYRFTGVIDRLVWKGEGQYEIHDYKTGRTPPTQEQLEHNEQLAIYHLSVKQRWPDVKDVKLIWHYVALNKDFVSHRKEEDLKELERRLVDRIQVVENARAFPPRESALCAWCEFRTICPLWRHEIKVTALSPKQYAEDSGVQLVSRYVELTRQKDQVEKELLALQEAIFQYAEREGVGQLDGPEHRLRIHVEEELGVPLKKDDPIRWEKLRQVMLRAGKYQDVSTINGRMLVYQLERGNWPAALRAEVQAMLQPQLRKYLRLYKKTST